MNGIKRKFMTWNNLGKIVEALMFAHGAYFTSFFAVNLGFCYGDAMINGFKLNHAKIWKDSALAGLNWPIMLYFALFERPNTVGFAIISSKN